MLLLEPVPEDDDVPPALEPLLGLPVVMPSSFRHFSRSLPVMPRHLLLELVLGEAPGALPVEPVALLPDAPPEGPVLCANDTLESAKSAAAVAALRSFSVIFTIPPYLLELDPLELGLLELEPLELGLLELGLWVLLLPVEPLLDGLLLDDDGLLELEVPPPALLPDLPIAASHSWREIEPSLFLSTDENVGVEPLAPLELDVPPAELDVPPAELELGEDVAPPAALGLEELGEDELGEAEELDAPPEAPPEDLLLSVALGLALDAPPLVPDEVLWAAATPASANRAAAVAVPTTLSIMCEFLLGDGRLGELHRQ